MKCKVNEEDTLEFTDNGNLGWTVEMLFDGKIGKVVLSNEQVQELARELIDKPALVFY